VEDGVSGFLVGVGDAEDLAQAMITFSDMPKDDRMQMGSCGRKRAQELFDENKIAADMYRIIQQALEAPWRR
jgi:glycosyltransferase involved in cell wall biosynthesis